jgi:hypothetical protein
MLLRVPASQPIVLQPVNFEGNVYAAPAGTGWLHPAEAHHPVTMANMWRRDSARPCRWSALPSAALAIDYRSVNVPAAILYDCAVAGRARSFT